MSRCLLSIAVLITLVGCSAAPPPVPLAEPADDDDASPANDDDDASPGGDDDDASPGADDDDTSPGPDDDDAGDDDDTTGQPDDDDSATPADDDDADPALDPFAPRPDASQGLVNTSADLEELLEFGALEGACEAWAATPADAQLELLCGKWMFFYEGFGTIGIPQPLVDWMARSFPDEVGPAFEDYGLVPDPHASTPEQPRHLGLGEGAPQNGTPTLALTCANCHFGQMPDGRYAVGYPNLQYEYATHMLALFIAPSKGMPGFDPADYHPDALARVQPLLDRFDADPLLGLSLAWDLLPMLLGGASDIPGLPYDVQGQYAGWEDGTMDFAITPLPMEDGVHTVSRILPLWGIPTADEMDTFGMSSALLAWTGAATSITQFLEGFVVVGGGDVEAWGPTELEPLRAYIESLDAPAPLVAGDPAAVTAGRGLFASEGCEGCHAGPRGGGLEVYEYSEIGTDAALALWGDADGDGVLCCGQEGELTGGIKAPRLGGLGHLGRFLHNGSLTSLEQLLCLEPRPSVVQEPFGAQGHEYGCGLTGADRVNLIAFLESL